MTTPEVVVGPPTTSVTLHAARRRRVPGGVRRLLGPILLLVVWQLAFELGLIDARTLAPPSTVLGTGWDLVQSGELPRHLWVSVRRVSIGLALGVSAGVVLALVSGLFRLGEDLVDGPVQMLRTMPVLALVPLFILWFGIDETPKIALIALGTMFPVYLNTHAGVRNVDARLVEVGTTFGLDRRGLVRQVILPGALPSFLVGLRYSLGIAWLVLVVSEQINATAGIGYLMTTAREFFRTDVIVLGLVIYGVLGLLSDVLVRLLEKGALSWRRGFTGT